MDRIGTLPLRQTKAVANAFAARAGVWPPHPTSGAHHCWHSCVCCCVGVVCVCAVIVCTDSGPWLC